LLKNQSSSIGDLIEYLLSKYKVIDMNGWYDVNADLVITDPPFGIKFTGRKNNYNRNSGNVVNGYVEWGAKEYREKVYQLLNVIYRNLNDRGQALIFSGWNHSNIIHNEILNFKKLTLRGKLYWVYNFAPYCRKKPAHNVYEIFWVTKGNKWTYNPKCNTAHCNGGESNLTTLIFKRDYKSNMPKYPTRLAFNLLKCLVEHFSNSGDLIFDPLAGSGMVGVVAYFLGRKFILGDLNKNGKLVFKHLLEYYIRNNSIFSDKNNDIIYYINKKLNIDGGY